MSLKKFTNFVQKTAFVLKDFLEDLYFCFADDFFLRHHIEIVKVAEVEAELTTLLQPFKQISGVQI